MTIRVELNPETEERLRAEARAKGLPLEKVAEQLADLLGTTLNRPVAGRRAWRWGMSTSTENRKVVGRGRTR